jgi:hypothetical protein
MNPQPLCVWTAGNLNPMVPNSVPRLPSVSFPIARESELRRD